MTLDLSEITSQIVDMAATLDPAYDTARFGHLHSAWNSLDSADVSDRLAEAKSSFLLPSAHRDFRAKAPLPAPVEDYVVGATDGSFILPNRHSPARFYLINTGSVLLHYGDQHGAEFHSEPQLYYRDEDMVVPNALQRIPINGTTIGPKRAADEMTAAGKLLASESGPAVALQDGTLVLWQLETLPDAVGEWVLPGFLDALRAFRDRGQPVASYISAPGSNEIMNLLRISICDYPPEREVNCDHCRRRWLKDGREPYCERLPHVTDRYLFSDVASLADGERSAVFTSTSKILQRYKAADPDFEICYFYINAGREISRVEIPHWVAEDADQLELVHWAIYDQCQRGRGYPVVLQEAHEMAVINVGDRRLVEDTVERILAQRGIVITNTGKDGSKRVRII